MPEISFAGNRHINYHSLWKKDYNRNAPLCNRAEAAALNTSFSCYWAPFVVCAVLPDEWRVPVRPASCPAASQGSDVGLPPLSSCLYFCWHPSTSQPSCFQPSTSFAAACHYTLIKMLDMKGGWLAFFHFSCLPSVENSVYARADVICGSRNRACGTCDVRDEVVGGEMMWEMFSNMQANTPDVTASLL